MRFGICTSLENVNRLAEVGYDYIELGVRPGLMPEADETEFQKIREQVANAPLKPESYSGFIPGDLRVVGDTVDFPRLSRYVETACRRANEIGGEIIVYGSSGSRNVEDGYSRERALSQIAEFLDMAADHAESAQYDNCYRTNLPARGKYPSDSGRWSRYGKTGKSHRHQGVGGSLPHLAGRRTDAKHH